MTATSPFGSAPHERDGIYPPPSEQLDLLEHARGMGMRVAFPVPEMGDMRERPEWVGPNPASHEGRWWEFHLAHPDVYLGLVKLARRQTRRGSAHLGISMLWETLRYRTMLGARTPDEDLVKLNNNLRAYYARFIMERCPDLDRVFSTRKVPADGRRTDAN